MGGITAEERFIKINVTWWYNDDDVAVVEEESCKESQVKAKKDFYVFTQMKNASLRIP